MGAIEEIKRIKREVTEISCKMLYGKTLEEVINDILIKVIKEDDKNETLD